MSQPYIIDAILLEAVSHEGGRRRPPLIYKGCANFSCEPALQVVIILPATVTAFIGG